MYIAINIPFLLEFEAWLLVLILFVLMLISIKVGKLLAKRRMRQGNFPENVANSTIYKSVFALLAFIVAFTFGMGATRFDARRQAIITEANAIGTAILRADLYPDSERVILRQYFRGYLNGKISYIKSGPDLEKMDSSVKVMMYYKGLLWQHTARFAQNKEAPYIISSQMIPALNDMFSAASTTRNNERLHVPQSIVIMLFILSVIAAFFLGYISIWKGQFDWFTGIGFCVLISLVIYITLDLDRPRRGLITLDSAWQSILSLENQFKKE